MMRLLKVCIMATVIVLIAMPLFAEVKDVKVSGDVETTAVYRNNFDLMNSSNSGRSCGYGDNDNRLITTADVKVDASLIDNVKAEVRMLSEWEWSTEDNTGSVSGGSSTDLESDILVDLANITLKEVFYEPLTVIVGRQALNYQDGFIVGDPDTNALSGDSNIGFGDLSKVKSFDAVRVILDYNPLTVDLIYSKIDETGQLNDDEDLYGAMARYQFDGYNALVEGFLYLSKDNDETASDPDTDAISPGHEVYIFGLKGGLTPVDNLNVTALLALQKGDFDATSATKRDQDAYAYELAGDYTFVDMKWSPIVKLGLTHYSGEETANTGDNEAWIPLYEDTSHGMIANYILSGINGGQNSNADIINIGVEASPLEDLTVDVDLFFFSLDEKLVNSDNSVLTANDATNYVNIVDSSYLFNSDKDLGYEMDIALNYDYTEDVKIGLSIGWFVPGDALKGASGGNTNDETATQVLATVGVSF